MLHYFGNHLQNVVNLFIGIVFTQGKAQGTVGHIVDPADGQQHMAGIQRAGGTGGTGRSLNTLEVQHQQQAFAFDAFKAEADIVGQTVEGVAIEGEALLLLLDAQGVYASSGSACTSGSLDPSHVLLAIGRVHDVAHGSLRLSLSEYNTEEEIDHILAVVPQVVQTLRNMSPVWRDLQTGKREYIL